MNITIISVGKIKEKFYRDAISEYAKRMSRYGKFDIIEVSDEQTKENASDTENEIVKQKEAERILKSIKNDAYVITLEILGKKMDSVQFADKLNKLALQGNSHIVFIIGGSLGLHESVSRRANEKLSFSVMTFPHQLMRVILLEQIYRAFNILGGGKYHK